MITYKIISLKSKQNVTDTVLIVAIDEISYFESKLKFSDLAILTAIDAICCTVWMSINFCIHMLFVYSFSECEVLNINYFSMD